MSKSVLHKMKLLKVKQLKLKIMKKTLMLLTLTLVFHASVFGQSSNELQDELKSCDCFVKSMKKYADLKHKVWNLAEFAPKNMKRGDESIRIQHDCSPNNPTSGLYNYSQVVNNIKKFEPECNRMRSELGGSSINNSTEEKYENQNQSATVAAYSGAPAENVQEVLMREYAPQDFATLKYSQNIQRQGEMITKGLTSQLDNYNNLIETSNPQDLLIDFESKMQNIENLEQQYLDQSFDFGYQRGAELADQINSGDGLGVFANVVNFISTASEMKKAEEKLAAQKEALRQQRLQKMSNIYWKAVEANDKMIDNYYKRAAYSKSLKDEKYNLDFVEHLKCYARKMKANFSSTSTSWLTNNCSKPVEPSGTGLQNMLVDKDEQLKNTANRKIKLFEETNKIDFLDAAISFAGSAANEKPSAENYFFLAELYQKKDVTMAYAMMLTAKQKKTSFFDDDKNRLFEKVKDQATKKTMIKLVENDVEYFKALLSAQLHRTIKINEKDLLSEAVIQDKPDIVQLVVNEEIKSLNDKERTKKIQQVVMLSAIQNSIFTIKRISELGVGIDFTLKGKTPLEVASESSSIEAYQLLKTLSSDDVVNKIDNKSVLITEKLVEAEKNPIKVANEIESYNDEQKVANLVVKFVEYLEEKPNYLDALVNSKKAIAYANSNAELQTKLKNNFAIEVLRSGYASQAHKYIESGLIQFKEIPRLIDITDKSDLEKNKKEIEGIDKEQLIEIYKKLGDKELFKSYLKSYYGLTESKIGQVFSRLNRKNINKQNIAFLAYENDNPKLFKALDKLFDLGTVKEGDVYLKDFMFKNNDLILTKEFYSKDFNVVLDNEFFLKQLNNMKYTSKIRENDLSYKFDKLLKIFGISANSKFSKTGGSTLHWIVDDMLFALESDRANNVSGFYGVDTDMYKDILIVFDIDKSIKDNNGKTAYKYLKLNKRNFYNIKEDHDVDFRKRNVKINTGKKTYNKLEELFELYGFD